MAIVMSKICSTFLDPIMALKLYEYGIMANLSGYIFVFNVVSYSLFGILGGYMTEYASKRNLILFGYIVGFFTFMVIGHQCIIGVDILPLIMLGLFMNGLSCVCQNVFATMYIKS
jgi:MFS family permease